MAEINGTSAADVLAGTNEDDSIFGGGAADVISGNDGNDTIDGGAGADNVEGNDGNDVFVAPDAAGDTIDGGAGTDILLTDLAAGDDLVAGGFNLGALAGVDITVEQVQVGNASDQILTLGVDASIGMDVDLVSNDGAAQAGTSEILDFDGTGTGALTSVNAVQAGGVFVSGTTYAAGDTIPTSNGGEIAVAWTGTQWQFTYTPPAADLLQVGDATTASDDIAADAITATIVEFGTNASIQIVINPSANYNADIDASAQTSAVNLIGDSQANHLEGGTDGDFISGGAGADSLEGNGGNDQIFAGADDAGADTIDGDGGDDELGGGAGNDDITGGDGSDTMYGGTGNDTIVDGGTDDKATLAWAGAGNDNVTGDEGGNDTLGGGVGNDTIDGGDGDDIIYGGGDDSVSQNNDDIVGGEGNDIVYGGVGADTIDGEDDDDELFNGAGDDVVDGSDGADTLWGGAGDDQLTGGNGDDTFGFISGNGNDTITDFQIGEGSNPDDGSTVIGDVLDLTAFGFADTQAVLDATTDAANSVIAIAPGQTITLTGITKTELQATTDDWVLV